MLGLSFAIIGQLSLATYHSWLLEQFTTSRVNGGYLKAGKGFMKDFQN
jgi:hypothetical protein